MPTPHDQSRVEFAEPATYRIVVQGRLEESGRRRLADMKIESTGRDGSEPRTTLVGVVQDQAELRGVLDVLYGLHLPVLAVDLCVGE